MIGGPELFQWLFCLSTARRVAGLDFLPNGKGLNFNVDPISALSSALSFFTSFTSFTPITYITSIASQTTAEPRVDFFIEAQQRIIEYQRDRPASQAQYEVNHCAYYAFGTCNCPRWPPRLCCMLYYKAPRRVVSRVEG